jgi:Tfp pilus assembly ATPase PilU
MRTFYEKLVAKGKPKKMALVAVMRKLLVLAYGVLKSGKPFDVNYQNQSKLGLIFKTVSDPIDFLLILRC